MIGPTFSTASESRSSVSRAPVRSKALTSIRHRSHTKARRILTSEPVQVRGRTIAADEIDEKLFERLRAHRGRAYGFNRPLRDEPPLCDHADVRRETLDDLE